MNYYIYAKDQENVLLFENVVNMVIDREDSVYYSTESSRSHKELEAVKQTCNYSDGVIVYRLSALGATDTEIDAQLEWFIRQSIRLIICTIPSTYQYGIGQPVNKAVLATIRQSLYGTGGLPFREHRRSNAGRKKIAFPDNWEQLYKEWEQKKISSKQFMDSAGLKKATFYNLLAEYQHCNS